MASHDDNEIGFSESDLHFAYETFYRDCPNGYCSKRKFLQCMRKSSIHTSIQKPTLSKRFFQTLITRQNYRQTKRFFSMMFDIYDRDHDGKLDFNDYIYALSALTGANRLHTIETLYNFFDTNNQGYITRQEFNSRKKVAAKFLGRYKSTSSINDNLPYDQEFNEMNTKKDGRISKEEFMQWHLPDHLTSDDVKPVKKRTRILKNLSHLVDTSGQIKTSSLQQNDNNYKKNSVDDWLETTMNLNRNFELSSARSMNTDQYLLKIFRGTQNHIDEKKQSLQDDRRNIKQNSIDDQSDSGILSSSSGNNLDDDWDSNSLYDIDEDDLQSIDANNPNELLCRSFDTALLETIFELSQLRSNDSHTNSFMKDDHQLIITRL